MNYKLIRTDHANDQIYEIMHYIKGEYGLQVALDSLENLEEAIKGLKKFPNKGVVPRYSILKKQGFRVLIVEKLLVFYKVDTTKKEIIVYSVFDGRREYRNMI